jgi:hypothetical protein
LFLVLILGPKAFAIAMVRVFVRVMLLGTIVLALMEVLLSGSQPISIAGIKRYVAVTPVGVPFGVAIAARNPVRIVRIVQSIDIRPQASIVIAVLVARLVPVTIAALEVVAIAHVIFIAQVRAPIVFTVEARPYIIVQVRTALAKAVSIPMLIAVLLGVHRTAIVTLGGRDAR